MSQLRVMVHDAWDTVVLPWDGEQALADVKRTALETARVTAPGDHFVLKFRGAVLPDEGLSVNEAAIPANASLIALRRRRRPVR